MLIREVGPYRASFDLCGLNIYVKTRFVEIAPYVWLVDIAEVGGIEAVNDFVEGGVSWMISHSNILTRDEALFLMQFIIRKWTTILMGKNKIL